MPKFTNPAYSIILTLQILHLAVDLLCNAATVVIATKSPVTVLVLFLIQGLSILFGIVLIFLILFNTYAFKAGLLSFLVWNFSGTFSVSILYFLLTVGYYSWNLSMQWGRPNSYNWSDGLQAVYVLQKLLAVVYYYVYKRAALRLGDPKYYEDSSWLRQHITAR